MDGEEKQINTRTRNEGTKRSCAKACRPKVNTKSGGPLVIPNTWAVAWGEREVYKKINK